jgi:glc operon protein GlcG
MNDTTTANGLLASKPALTLAAAKVIASKADRLAVAKGTTMCIAIVDDGGNLVYFQRADGTQIGSIEVALAKARTAIAFKRPTKVFQDAVDGGRPSLLSLPHAAALTLEGGVPLMNGQAIIGAIGVSGESDEVDGEVARAGASAVI